MIIHVDGIKKILKDGLTIMSGTMHAGESVVYIDEADTTKYSDAVKAITGSGMWSSDKQDILKVLPTNLNPDVYEAIIIIANDKDMISGSRRSVIMSLCNTK